MITEIQEKPFTRTSPETHLLLCERRARKGDSGEGSNERPDEQHEPGPAGVPAFRQLEEDRQHLTLMGQDSVPDRGA